MEIDITSWNCVEILNVFVPKNWTFTSQSEIIIGIQWEYIYR